MPRGPSRALRRRAGAVLGVPLALALAACGLGVPVSAPPSGVDGLVVPTPSPDPADYVAGVDNPWLPLQPGSGWTYSSSKGRTVTVSVTGTARVAGVEATVVDTVERTARGRVADRASAWFAQDRDGNVWHLGDEGVWRTGEAGAQAGLVMPATPRTGDGFVQEQASGVAADRSLVLSVDARRTTPYAAFEDLVQVEQTSPLDPAAVRQGFYARGVGLVLEEGTGRDLELVGLTRG